MGSFELFGNVGDLLSNCSVTTTLRPMTYLGAVGPRRWGPDATLPIASLCPRRPPSLPSLPQAARDELRALREENAQQAAELRELGDTLEGKTRLLAEMGADEERRAAAVGAHVAREAHRTLRQKAPGAPEQSARLRPRAAAEQRALAASERRRQAAMGFSGPAPARPRQQFGCAAGRDARPSGMLPPLHRR